MFSFCIDTPKRKLDELQYTYSFGRVDTIVAVNLGRVCPRRAQQLWVAYSLYGAIPSLKIG